MKQIKILMIRPYLPEQDNVATIIAKNVLNAINKSSKTEIIWILQTPEQNICNTYENILVKPIQLYDNACELIDKEKPDVIFTELSFAYSSYPLIIAGRYKKIPIVGYLDMGYAFSEQFRGASRLKSFISKLRRFFSNNSSNNKKIFSRGQFYLSKYSFLLKTIKASDTGFLFLLRNLFENIWFNSLGIIDLKRDSRLNVDAVCLSTPTWVQPLTDNGLKKEILHVTGSPLFDNYNIESINFKKFNGIYPIRVLFLPIPLHTHGKISKREYLGLITNILEKLKNSDKVLTSIKIHPTSDHKEDYVKILNKINYDVSIFQKEKLSELIKNYDVAVSFGDFSNAHMESILSGIPLVMITNDSNLELTTRFKVARSCKNINSLVATIEEVVSKPPSKENLSNFLFSYSDPFDGNASERISQIIIKMLKQSQ